MITTRKLILTGIVLIFVWGCKSRNNKTESTKNFVSAISYIRGQVAKVDTSVYSIEKIVFVDSVRRDTTYLRREQFGDAAIDFLNLPDLADADHEEHFKEESQYDETLGRVMLIYTPLKPKEEVIQRQEVLVKPQPGSPEDQITSIYINTSQNNKDSSIERKMLWRVDESFQVTTTRQYPGQPEITSTYKVSWNESEL